MCVKGFFYRFMYVCVREKMAGKVNRYLLMDYQTGISQLTLRRYWKRIKGVILRNTRKAVNKERLCFTPKHLLQEIFSLRHVVIDVRLLDNSTPPGYGKSP